jgi:hypothetical protein
MAVTDYGFVAEVSFWNSPNDKIEIDWRASIESTGDGSNAFQDDPV